LIYSGGDDFTLVGSWDQVVDLANEIYKRFYKFANNKEPDDSPTPGNITFSAGLQIARPQTPIFDTTELANELLHDAKDFRIGRKSHIKRGKVGGHYANEGRYLKYPIAMYHAGSVFKTTKANAPYYGRYINDIHPSRKEIIHYGFAFPLPGKNLF